MLGHVKKWLLLLTILIFVSEIAVGSSTKSLKHVLSLSPAESKLFLDSFDTVVADCDGVLWYNGKIPGVKEIIEKLKMMGKKIHFVSNSSSRSKNDWKTLFNEIGIDLNPIDLIYPSLSMIDYLKSQNFTKKVFIVGTSQIVKQFEDAGLSCIYENPFYTTDVNQFINNVTRLDQNIGAVAMYMDSNLNYYTISKVIHLLRNPDVMFLVGSEDKVYRQRGDFQLPGLGYFSEMITQITGRRPTISGKPSESLKETVFKQYNITEPERTIFIGDTLVQDMGFADICGFQKLFVLSGGNSLEDAMKLVNPVHIPDYWIESLGHLQSILA